MTPLVQNLLVYVPIGLAEVAGIVLLARYVIRRRRSR
jgi:hypothetical protein